MFASCFDEATKTEEHEFCDLNSSQTFLNMYALKMLGCFNPILGQIWTNPSVGLKIQL